MSQLMSHRLGWGLIVSLLVNALLIGLLLGQMAQAPDRRGADRPVISADLSKTDRQTLRRITRAAMAASAEERAAHREARLVARQALSLEPYDAEAVMAAFAAERLAGQAVAEKMQAVMAAQFGELPANERMRLAERALRGPRRPGRRSQYEAGGRPRLDE